MAWSVPIACIKRHALAIIDGEHNDPESGVPHLGAIGCNLVMLAHYCRHYPEMDDRPALVVREGQDDLIASRIVTADLHQEGFLCRETTTSVGEVSATMTVLDLPADDPRYNWDGITQASAEAMATGGINALTTSIGHIEGFITTEGDPPADMFDLLKVAINTSSDPRLMATTMLMHAESHGTELSAEIADYLKQFTTEAAQNG